MTTHAADRHTPAETPPPGPHVTTRRPRRRRWPWVLLTMLIALVTLFYVGGGYYFSSAIYHDVFEVRPGVSATTQTGILTDLTVPTNQI